jgi:membrane-associated phospholipid phosphatase
MATLCTDAVSRRLDLSWPARVLVGLVITAALVTPLYFFIDQPVMSFFRDCQLGRYHFLIRCLTRLPEAIVILSPFVFLAGLFRRWFTPWNRVEKVAVAAAVSTLFTVLAAGVLKITFGRGDDGFHPFHIGKDYWAFPSGHTACTACVAVVVGAALPRWRLCCWALVGIVGAALVVLAHHFVGDIPGGAFLGWAVGGTVARAFRLEQSSMTAPSN